MLEVRGLRAGYEGVDVLHGLDLHLAHGEVVAVLGPNRAGKTTLNRVLSGLVPARAGRIRFGGEDVSGADHVAMVRAGLIHVPQGRRLFPNLSVRDNLLLGATVRARLQRQATLAGVLDLLPPLRDRMARLAGSLNGGEQQMVAIGRGLMALPRLLVLDEPSLGLPPCLAEELFALIVRLNREGLSILLAERKGAQSLSIADRAYVIEHGRVALDGSATAVSQHPRLRSILP